ncbi:esterase [Virgisporangium aliadipatigenens]|uniref:Esterase n=1 Tax=Virgisporangium aliadipatigenens TaxID=741659 RepID=A0A8J3YH03_9ACTN|nr:serine hydrolase domain-containing protein [Virgisporangium aliadipatigenens]GIJ45104.1 esterase [Virgisporangium aliadipatigenens]
MTINGWVANGYEAVRTAFDRNSEIGAAVCVYRHGRVVADLWVGTADRETGRAWERDTPVVLHSTGKGVVAACVHLLVRRGLLDLDAPVARYWPEFAAAGKERLPVRFVLSHRAGLPSLGRRVPLADALAGEPVVRLLAALRPQWEPGTAHGYHGVTYGWLVGELVRRVSGVSLGAFLAREIAAPLGLDLWIGTPPAVLPRVARLDSPPIPGIENAPEAMLAAFVPTVPAFDLNDPAQLAAEIPAVNGVGTAHALARFYAALIGPVDGVRILDEATLATAVTEQANGPDRMLGITTRPALGFGLPTPGMPWYSPTAFGFPGHGGSLGYADPAEGIAFGYVPNRLHVDPFTPDPRAASLVRAVRGALSSGAC